MAERASLQALDIIRRIGINSPVRFDPGTFALAGSYGDELTVYRARRGWRHALETHFLLESGTDFVLAVVPDPGSERYSMRCEFVSACGRAAFWRITHHEAPEAQCLIETAHIPLTDANFEALVATPDMQPMAHPAPLIPGLPEATAPSRWLSRLWAALSMWATGSKTS